MNKPVAIQSTDFWVKVLEMLQQNRAVIETEDTSRPHHTKTL